jgi:transcriptional regulator with XRE-family HTH domain
LWAENRLKKKEKYLMNAIAEKIKLIRIQNRLSQKEYGKRLTVSGSYISKIESGSETPSDMLIKLIALEFNVSEKWLISGDAEEREITNYKTELSVMKRRLVHERSKENISICCIEEMSEATKVLSKFFRKSWRKKSPMFS